MFSAWNSVSLLVVSLSLCNSAPPTPPLDCESWVTPLTLDHPAMKIAGRWNFIEGFADHDLFISTMKTVDSAWIDITASPEDCSTFTMMEYNRINGTCYREQAKITLVSDIIMDITHKDPSDTHVGQINRGTLLPTCINCLLFDFNTSVSGIDTPIRSLHLLAREGGTLKESELQLFHQQAKCLNFSLPASFHSNREQEFCTDDNMTVAVTK